jgi:hypothetical protein
VENLLSEGIINADGTPGKHFNKRSTSHRPARLFLQSYRHPFWNSSSLPWKSATWVCCSPAQRANSRRLSSCRILIRASRISTRCPTGRFRFGAPASPTIPTPGTPPTVSSKCGSNQIATSRMPPVKTPRVV